MLGYPDNPIFAIAEAFQCGCELMPIERDASDEV